MMNVLGCLDIPTRGDYLLDGTDVREVTRESLRQRFGMVLQAMP
jgi:putative ABC transport system ATP-binding protein